MAQMVEGDKIYCSTFLRPMEISIQLQTIKSGWFIVYIKGSKVIIIFLIVFLSLEILS